MLFILFTIRFPGKFHGIDHILESLTGIHLYKLNRQPIYLCLMTILLAAYAKDPAGSNMARYLRTLQDNTKASTNRLYDIAIIDTPVISADQIELDFEHYDSFVFLSRHSAESGKLALTCHTTGNFDEAHFGGNPQQVAVPMPSLQKQYMKMLWERRADFKDFDITLEATHHGPTALGKPTIFVEVGTTKQQWNDTNLCSSVAAILHSALHKTEQYQMAVGFGGTHYPKKFTEQVICGKYAIGTIVPKRALRYINESMLAHILSRNYNTRVALLDWNSMGKHRRDIVRMLESVDVNIIKL